MGKYRLTALKPQLPTLPPKVGYSPGDTKARNDARVGNEPWRRWYRTKRWAKLRWSVLTRDLWRCQKCGRIITEKGAAHCDHVKPHKGNAELFWKGELQTLCIECHTKKSMDEREPW